MNAILTTSISILAICAAAWAARRLTRLPLCPTCLGVAGTWSWMLVARELGYTIDATMLAILLGGSVAGGASLVEKHLPQGRSALLWKTLFIPSGFVAAYALVAPDWLLFAAAAAALVLLGGFFMFAPAAAINTDSPKVEELTEKMRNCC